MPAALHIESKIRVAVCWRRVHVCGETKQKKLTFSIYGAPTMDFTRFCGCIVVNDGIAQTFLTNEQKNKSSNDRRT